MNLRKIDQEYCAPDHVTYMILVQDKEMPAYLERQSADFDRLLSGLSEEQANARYAPGKWTVKEMVQHITDTERIFSYRLLAIARGEQQELPGFNQDDYAAAVDVSGRSLDSLRQEFLAVRASTLWLANALEEEALERRGTIIGHEVRAGVLPYVIAGHLEHHLHVLRTKYGL